MDKFVFRYATKDDAALVLQFIKDIAEYEKMSDQVVNSEELLLDWVFEKK